MKTEDRSLELLSPAKNLSTGIAAIEHGADAVYIGPPAHGARQSAANSINDIQELCTFAHFFKARIYCTVNTLLFDGELQPTVDMIHQLYKAGVDALIIQDFGLLECDLPPIDLHASTQMDNRTADKTCFLEKCGFSQVVLARELHLKQIEAIARQSDVILECFVHGALCVSYSGKCYQSAIVKNRSGNRGQCSQLCRHKYTLQDSTGKNIVQDKYLLSLKDLNLSSHLDQLIQAGVSSFKIEGRLKDENYVKNITAFYRQKLDQLIDNSPHLHRSSSGKTSYSFTPDVHKTFNRNSTSYFLTQKRNKCGNIETPKNRGEFIGTVTGGTQKKVFIQTADYTTTLNNGDGLSYFTNGVHKGLRINKVEGSTLHLHKPAHIVKGTKLYRNHDEAFLKELQASKKCRTIACAITVRLSHNRLQFTISDEDDITTIEEPDIQYEVAQKQDKAEETLRRQLKKSGDTLFSINNITMDMKHLPFLPMGKVNEIRRKLLAQHRENRQQHYTRKKRYPAHINHPYISDNLQEDDNITNEKAKEFFKKHGVTSFRKAPDLTKSTNHINLMTTKYCIKYQLDLCPHTEQSTKHDYREPFYLVDNTGKYKLEFNCKHCEMHVKHSD